ncbi:MAG: hypothetical protein AAF703_07535 [Cyanobacteria bacterium P01_D01_bin.105]
MKVRSAVLSYFPISTKEKRALKSLHNSPFFSIGLGFRLLLILLVFPEIQQEWFLPFITETIHPLTLDPWSTYINIGGDPISFPYGIVMYWSYLPMVGIGWCIDQVLHTSLFAKVGLGLTSLLFDYGILIGIALLVRQYTRNLLLLAYWWSPLVLYILYWHGQLDVLPVLLLVWGLCFLRWNRSLVGGIAVGLTISSKFSMLVALPFILIYLYRNSRLDNQIWLFLGATLSTIGLTVLPFFASAGYIQMVPQSREATRIYAVYLSYGSELKLFLLPTAYIFFLYFIWRLERITLDLFIISVGLGFFALLLLLPPATGWYLWVIPFLVFYELRAKENYSLMSISFSGIYLIYSLVYSTGADIPILSLNLSQPWAVDTFLAEPANRSIFFTIFQAYGLLICLRMYAYGIQRNNYYRMSRRPLVIGFSGDSGLPKHTLISAVVNLLGINSTSCLSGDDYHKWKRHHPMWSARTHLNPNASDLSRLTRDVSILVDGESVYNHHYGCGVGRSQKDQKIASRDFILVDGFHTLYLKRLREQIDLKVFFDLDEDLRAYWKAQQSKQKKYHSGTNIALAVAQYQTDSQRFIHTQAQFADIIFKLAPVNPNHLIVFERQPRLKLFVQMENGFFHEELVHSLVSLCSMHVDIEQSEHLEFITLCIEGEADSEDISAIARLFIPNLEELTVQNPLWHCGYTGLMQVIVLAHISEILHRGRRYSHA